MPARDSSTRLEIQLVPHITAAIRTVWSGPTLAPKLDITRIDIPIANLPVGLDGFTIAQVSDLHVGRGRWDTPDDVAAGQAVRKSRPDVVVNTGDYLWRQAPIAKVEEESARFLARGKSEVEGPRNIAILGNHDYHAGEATVRALTLALEGQGVRVLVNRAVCVKRGSDGVSIVGITDDASGIRDGITALEASARPRVALVHKPDLARCLPAGAADLVLSGHTHGGQVTLPGLERAIVQRFCGSNYVAGLYAVNGMPVYVNRGLGCTGLPLRFRAAPEVTIIRLVH